MTVQPRRPRITKVVVVVACALLDGAPHAHADKRASVELSLAVYSSDSSIGFSDGASGTQIDGAWITMQDLRFRPVSSCNSSTVPVAIQGPITADLIRGRASRSASLALGRYCAFDLSFRRWRGRSGEASPELRGVSVVMTGKRRDGVRFVLRCALDTSPRLRARDVQGFAVSGSTHFILAADAARWLSGLDLSLASVTHDGPKQEIRIDERTNPELLAVFRGNVDAGLGLFLDVNQDQVLDEDERAHAIASGDQRQR